METCRVNIMYMDQAVPLPYGYSDFPSQNSLESLIQFPPNKTLCDTTGKSVAVYNKLLLMVDILFLIQVLVYRKHKQ